MSFELDCPRMPAYVSSCERKSLKGPISPMTSTDSVASVTGMPGTQNLTMRANSASMTSCA